MFGLMPNGGNASLRLGRGGIPSPQPLSFRPPECLPAKVLTAAGTARIFCERTAGPNKEKKE
ncbi:MAG: hypothetical protein A3E37_02150 [Candidatus Andersenbacteria bacterium RIFCSPHIGHO2_12_FULL_46_9]|nr:MAG: hypothetical protein A3B76_06530 [Candidatus Andersenbacteria bacterium RIFCSPHIGHO2_02_FULL_46_16]OGY37606.1 MAG: hypothetical protein A3E37_02150 [Candidatus Andersenbacteria bacterium RIFCSPHIGHO2_12_FULL_46_9]OGY37899.1 MAG: hypothetical protein A3I08_01790 [Candidatus Andersenbacteria bacterium RIFCSPLOWO2_02_FULL_46_11]OGY42889.1 MAG: hypothetical protein A3G57_04410 [Candidatus Andersenbacteria bacterium RIFCSPLOWO2_12_FULL_45_8]